MLYVADFGNHRIQRFHPIGNVTGETVAESCSIVSNDELILDIESTIRLVSGITNISISDDNGSDNNEQQEEPGKLETSTKSITTKINDDFATNSNNKRRAWSVQEKLRATKDYQKCMNFSQISKKHGSSTKCLEHGRNMNNFVQRVNNLNVLKDGR
ncbi:unnamed protein product [Didymodactylos carnosus]|uniref:Uncharacterized protein n=1 Tax=Didymodactylos carnosus TaxID=1234261 RepID=A0A814CZ91_9BILA|nr:unnamed protein product [Didymodactylos carnosus]CAF3724650.1 unnamed protein product [Didymodactylos carnosus]